MEIPNRITNTALYNMVKDSEEFKNCFKVNGRTIEDFHVYPMGHEESSSISVTIYYKMMERSSKKRIKYTLDIITLDVTYSRTGNNNWEPWIYHSKINPFHTRTSNKVYENLGTYFKAFGFKGIYG